MGLAASAAPLFPRATFLAVAIDEKGMRLARSGKSGDWQTLDARKWPEDRFTRMLFTAIDDHLCRLLMAYLKKVELPAADGSRLRRAFAKKAQVFLSHSKHDPENRGEAMALNLKTTLAAMSAETFFDAIDLPPRDAVGTGHRRRRRGTRSGRDPDGQLQLPHLLQEGGAKREASRRADRGRQLPGGL